jgi:hypothetical protein
MAEEIYPEERAAAAQEESYKRKRAAFQPPLLNRPPRKGSPIRSKAATSKSKPLFPWFRFRSGRRDIPSGRRFT